MPDPLYEEPLERSARAIANELTEVTRDCLPAHKWGVSTNGYEVSLRLVGAEDENRDPVSQKGIVNIGGVDRHVQKISAPDNDASSEISPEVYHRLKHAFASQGIISTEERRDPDKEYPVGFRITSFSSHYPNIRLGLRLSQDVSRMTMDAEWLAENRGHLKRAVISHTRGFAFYQRKLTRPITAPVRQIKYRLWQAKNYIRSFVPRQR